MSENGSDRTAWGLELGGSAVRLVQVTAAADGYRVERLATAELADRWTRSVPPAEAVARLDAACGGGRLTVAVADAWVLYRALSLPDAAPQALERMVAAQVETVLPAQAALFEIGWAARPDPARPGRQTVLAAAIGRMERAAATEAG